MVTKMVNGYPRQILNEAEKGELFTGHLRLAAKMATRFATRFGRSFRDMQDEAESILAVTICQWSDPGGRGYNPTKVKPTTWLYRRLFWSLLTLNTRKCRREKPFSDYRLNAANAAAETVDPFTVPVSVSWLSRLLRTVGEDARTVIEIITMAPADLAADIRAEYRTDRQRLRAQMAVVGYLASLGWTEDRVAAALDEVTAAF